MENIIKSSVVASFEVEKIIEAYKKNIQPIEKSTEKIKEEEIKIKPIYMGQHVDLYI